MSKKIVISVSTVIILFSISIYKYVQFNNNRLNNYSDRLLWLATNTSNSVWEITEQATTEEYFNQSVKNLITNLYALHTALDSGKILLLGDDINGSRLYYSLDSLIEGLNYNNLNKTTIEELNAITRATDILIQRFRPYEGDGKNISKKEIIEAIQLSSSEMRIIESLE